MGDLGRREGESDFLYRVLRGNEAAVTYCEILGQITQVIDDLYDGDQLVDKNAIDRCFWQCLVALPCNPFYQEYFTVLQPQFQMAYIDWINSNSLERGTADDKHLAFVLRDSLVGLVVTCARLIGGYEYARRVGPEIRRYFHDEPLGLYMEERSE